MHTPPRPLGAPRHVRLCWTTTWPDNGGHTVLLFSQFHLSLLVRYFRRGVYIFFPSTPIYFVFIGLESYNIASVNRIGPEKSRRGERDGHSRDQNQIQVQEVPEKEAGEKKKQILC